LDTKWKKWTAIKAVKIISFLLIIILGCLALNRFFDIDRRVSLTGVGTNIIFADASSLPEFTSNVVLENSMIVQYTFVTAQIYNAHLRDMIILIACLVLMPVLLIILLAGVGRIYSADGKEVYFTIIDKLYLDVSLGLVAAWSALTISVVNELWRTYLNFLHQSNIIAENILITLAVNVMFVPMLLWLISFVKRIKARKFWEHTLIFFILSRVFSLFLRLGKAIPRRAKNLWAGAVLTIKVSVITGICFVLLLLAVVFGSAAAPFALFFVTIIITPAIAFFLYRYASRINKLEKAVQAVSEGKYDTQIEVGGGELGSIATSVNNISSGINNAVNERMKSERLKTELITNVSHDIRTPLTSIITYSDLLKTEGLDSEKAPEHLDILIQKSQRLKTLTDELFEASKAATGNIDVNLEVLDSVALINQVLGELDSTVKSSGFDLKVNLPEHLYVKADGRLMQRVIENLLSNAFKYSLPSSRIYLDARKPDDNAHAVIELKNISAAELNFDPAELTERFKRGDDSRADGGSGLGLSIVQSFVSVQDGKFEISIDGDLFKAIVMLPVVS